MIDIRALLASGELHRIAKQSADRNAFARAIGLSNWEAYRKRRVRDPRCGLPDWDELRVAHDPHLADRLAFAATPEGQDAAREHIHKADNDDFADEEKTHPGIEADHSIEVQLADRKERSETVALRAKLKHALEALEQCRYERDTAIGAGLERGNVQPIVARETSLGVREATAVALASDWHIEEKVDRESVNGVNEYNLDIARRRAERYFAGLVYLLHYHRDHFAIRDLVLWLGGDLITGYLREENLEHNELSPVQAIATLHVWLADGIRQVLTSTDLECVHVVCNSGNHGRLTEKVRPSTREANSIEWLLYVGLAREFANEPRVKFTLPAGSQTYVPVYDWTIRFTHGDETKFGGGVGGIMIPIRKAIAKWQTVRHADLTVMGHYHSEHFLRDLVVNGSLVGYGPYSLSIAAPYEDPRQSFFLMDKHRGITFPSTIWVADRDAT